MKPKNGNKLPLETLRYRLKCFMEHDQRFKDMGLRKVWQRTEIWPFIKKNLDAILADKGKDGTGDYPACPYAAGLLVQHMDAARRPVGDKKAASESKVCTLAVAH